MQDNGDEAKLHEIRLLGSWYLGLGIAAGLVATFVVAVLEFDGRPDGPAGLGGLLSGLLTFVGPAGFVFAAPLIAVGIGLRECQSWARLTGIAFAVLNLLVLVALLAAGAAWWGAAEVGLPVITLLVLVPARAGRAMESRSTNSATAWPKPAAGALLGVHSHATVASVTDISDRLNRAGT